MPTFIPSEDQLNQLNQLDQSKKYSGKITLFQKAAQDFLEQLKTKSLCESMETLSLEGEDKEFRYGALAKLLTEISQNGNLDNMEKRKLKLQIMKIYDDLKHFHPLNNKKIYEIKKSLGLHNEAIRNSFSFANSGKSLKRNREDIDPKTDPDNNNYRYSEKCFKS